MHHIIVVPSAPLQLVARAWSSLVEIDRFRLSDALHIAEMACLIAAVGSVLVIWAAMGLELYRG